MKTLKKQFILLFSAISAFVILFACCFSFDKKVEVSANVESINITCEDATNKLLDDNGYVSFYKIPNYLIESYTSNGGQSGSAVLANAFDGNWSTYWQSSSINSANFFNNIEVNFTKTVTIDRILYASSSARYGHGYPVDLKIYTAIDGDYQFYGSVSSNAKNERVVFNFAEPIEIKKLRFEFTKVNPAHNWIASAKEIQFLQPDSEDLNVFINKEIFLDYAETQLNPNYNNLEAISLLRESVKEYNVYESKLKEILDRAELILNGAIKFDVRREFSTASDAFNKLEQWGDMRAYASNVLKMSSFGINRQTTGIAGFTGEQIVIYVDAEDGDPLPKIAFTQTYSSWQSWKREVNLARGKNVLTFPNLKTSHYTQDCVAGGPIHIINPYTPAEQSSNVKVYIENGYFYPVFHDGDDENEFKLYLKDYYERFLNGDDEVKFDIFEVVTDHVMLTSFASLAYEYYIQRNISPQINCDKWNQYMVGLLKFGGLALDKDDEFYDERNEHLYTNYRAVQPWSGGYAFAAADHIGLTDRSVFYQLVNRNVTGWAEAHELGHTLDNRERTWGEVTNNMWAYYDVMEFGLYDRLPLRNVCPLLASDITLTKQAFMSFGDNCVFWMTIEGAFPGYWANLENLYRFETTGKNLGRTERMVYYSSLATKINMIDYFERWGFYMNGDSAYTQSNRFTRQGMSSELASAMQQALDSGRFTNEDKKIWYIDTKQFAYLFKNDYKLGPWASCYTGNETIEVSEISKSGDNYSIFLPQPENEIAHLGYEISSLIDGEWKVVGFTYSTYFVDTNTYNSTPSYRVKAYDRLLNCTGYSESAFTPLDQNSVCKINDTYFNSISEAVQSATAGDTIVILKDIKESGIVVDKNLTITSLDTLTTDVNIFRYGAGNIFTINSGAILTISGQENSKLIIDGNGINQSGSLVLVNGELVVSGNVVFKNNITSGNGGAIFANGTVRLTNCEISGNKANVGGAVCTNNVRTYFTNVSINNNIATGNGGAIYNVGTSAISNCEFLNNISGSYGGAICNNNGGVMTISNTTFSGNQAVNGGGLYIDGNTTLTNSIITNNTASSNGGGIFYSGSNGARTLTINGGTIKENTSKYFNLLYLNKGNVNLGKSNISMPELVGDIYKSNSATISVRNELLDFTKINFTLQSVQENSILLTFNFDVTEDQIADITVSKAMVSLCERNVLVSPKMITLTINCGENNITIKRQVGEFVLEDSVEGLAENKYIKSWQYEDTNYNIGETVNLTSDCTLSAVLGNKVKITLRENHDDTVLYVLPNTYYYLPLNTPSGDEVCLWHKGDLEFVPATKVFANEDMLFSAESFGKILFTLKINDTEEKLFFKFGDAYSLKTPTAPEGKRFVCWNIDGTNYNAEEVVTIEHNMTAQAVFEDIPDDTEQPPNEDETSNDSQQTPNDTNDTPDGSNLTTILIIVGAIVVAMVAIIAIIVVIKKNKIKKYSKSKNK